MSVMRCLKLQRMAMPPLWLACSPLAPSPTATFNWCVRSAEVVVACNGEPHCCCTAKLAYKSDMCWCSVPLPLQPGSLQGMRALHVAAMLGHSRVIRTLLAAGANPSLPNSRGMLPLHLAATYKRAAAACLLLEAAPHTASAVAPDGSTPCHMAAQKGAAAIVRAMLDAAPELALAKMETGATPLHMAAQKGHDETVRQGACLQGCILTLFAHSC